MRDSKHSKREVSGTGSLRTHNCNTVVCTLYDQLERQKLVKGNELSNGGVRYVIFLIVITVRKVGRQHTFGA